MGAHIEFARSSPVRRFGPPAAVIGYPTVADDDAGKERSQDHTGTQVRIAAQGPQAANVVGVINQTDVFGILMRALDLS
jgi:alkaline phosphatase